MDAGAICSMGKPATELQDAILLATAAAGHRLFPNNQGVARYKTDDGKVYTVRYGIGPTKGGGGDLLGICADGIFASVEVKAGLDQSTDAQIKWAKFVRSRGGRAGIARSVEDALAICAG
jgi:hypothetical protein